MSVQPQATGIQPYEKDAEVFHSVYGYGIIDKVKLPETDENHDHVPYYRCVFTKYSFNKNGEGVTATIPHNNLTLWLNDGSQVTARERSHVESGEEEQSSSRGRFVVDPTTIVDPIRRHQKKERKVRVARGSGQPKATRQSKGEAPACGWCGFPVKRHPSTVDGVIYHSCHVKNIGKPKRGK